MTHNDRRMTRVMGQMEAAARHAAAARDAEAQSADAPAGSAGQAGLLMAAQCFRQLSAFNVTNAGRLTAGKGR